MSDAQSIEQYLLRELKVPPNHITTLYDETATREGILNALQSFHKNQWVAPGDPIFIYFAGHGGWGAAPPGWSSEGDKILLLFPYDTIGDKSSGATIGHGIPDRTIGAILNSLVQVLGDNIVSFHPWIARRKSIKLCVRRWYLTVVTQRRLLGRPKTRVKIPRTTIHGFSIVVLRSSSISQ